MNEPIKAGDRAKIIRGVNPSKSPNKDKLVTVGQRIDGNRGEPHGKYGPIVEVFGKELVRGDPESGLLLTGEWAHIPVAWLQKLPPEPTDPAALKVSEDLGITA